MDDKTVVIGKGIVAQIEEWINDAPVLSSKPLSDKGLFKLLDDFYVKERKEYIRKQKIIKKNIKDLKKREIELGEDAPWYLWYCTSTVETIYISAEQYKAWKKWF